MKVTKKLNEQRLAKLKSLHRAVEGAIRRQPDVLADESRGWPAKEQLTPWMDNLFYQIKDDTVMLRDVLVNRMHQPGDDKCRFCHANKESLDHILSHCKKLTFTDYLDRHDQVARQVLKAELEAFGIK
jgi:hypothetical protein